MKKFLFFLLVAFLSSTFSFAQNSNDNNASLGGYIWFDENLNGIREDGEHEVREILVYLVKDGISTNEYRKSDINGKYLFDNLEPNHKYFVKVLLPKNYSSFTKSNATEDESRDSDIITTKKEKYEINGVLKEITVGYSEEVTLAPGENYENLDAGMLCKCILEVEKSTNGKDADTRDEAVELKVGDEVTWEYKITNLSVSTFTNIRLRDDIEGEIECPKETLEPAEEMICTKKGIAKKGHYVNVAIVSGKNANGDTIEDRDPSHYIATSNLACLGDFYWYDENLNGIQDKDEYGIIGIQVGLYDENKKLLKTTKTDKEGNYLFCDLEPGNYYVKFELPDTYLFITKNKGSDIKDSDANSDGWSHLIELKDGEKDLTIDAGIYCSCNEYEVTGVKKDLSAISPLLGIVILIVMFLIAFTIKPEKGRK